MKADDFDIDNGHPIGLGALATVLRVRHKATGATVAVKVLSKIQLLQQKKVEAVLREKSILYRVGPHPHIIRLYGTAQSEEELYFFLECMPGGDLQEHIQRVRKMRIDDYWDRMKSLILGGGDGQKAAETTPAKVTTVTSTAAETDESGKPADNPAGEARRLTCAPWLPGLFCLPFSDIQLIMAQLVNVLEYLHQDVALKDGDGAANDGKQKPTIMLRDLKSENICFDDAGRAVLIDFDTAEEVINVLPRSNYGDPLRRHHPTFVNNPTATAAASDLQRENNTITISAIQELRKMSVANFVGTAQFISPELLSSLHGSSYASDLWALGVVLYQMTFGRYPFDGEAPFAVMKEVTRGLEPWRHFPLYSLARRTYDYHYHADHQKIGAEGAAGGPHPTASLFTFEQYTATCDLIRQLLQLDPVMRIGVNNGRRHNIAGDERNREAMMRDFFLGDDVGRGGRQCSIPIEASRRPHYDSIRQHAFFHLPGCAYSRSVDATNQSSLHSFDWAQLRRDCGLGLRGEKGSYALVPLEELPHRETEAQRSALRQHYKIYPVHNDQYTNHTIDLCSVGGALESYIVNGPRADVEDEGAGSPDNDHSPTERHPLMSLEEVRAIATEYHEFLAAAGSSAADGDAISSVEDLNDMLVLPGPISALTKESACGGQGWRRRATIVALQHCYSIIDHYEKERQQQEEAEGLERQARVREAQHNQFVLSYLREKYGTAAPAASSGDASSSDPPRPPPVLGVNNILAPNSDYSNPIIVSDVTAELAKIISEEERRDDIDRVVDDVSGQPETQARNTIFSDNTHSDFKK